jgi:hypothetical protein
MHHHAQHTVHTHCVKFACPLPTVLAL